MHVYVKNVNAIYIFYLKNYGKRDAVTQLMDLILIFISL